jgi:transcriptional regulator with GAF, ATPase, and Fis domain
MQKSGPYLLAGMKCVDCGKESRCFDHRYYAKPHEVDPVCVNCNRNRGPALDVRPLARAVLGMDGHQSTLRPQKPPKGPIAKPINLVMLLNEAERDRIVKALVAARYNRTKAAKLLGITPRSLKYRAERLKID